ncbi:MULTISPECIES: HvfC/BufC family peptide modification chaperone [unclassified Sphingomonas]|uniref:HvfC/BufC family peptide modification chaperone n=1 Tax=unclassified Sphingomonas TaxID=196159 RepID=UPI0008312800|nr:MULTISPECIES: putative DNA-binding domain-containing protein [unclassified Sphingomonas]
MTALARLQDAFLACLHDDDAPLPPGLDATRAAGMAVYRNGYRARLLDVLADSYARTARLVGAEAFHQAAAHHLIAHPPSTWTIDRAGEGFAETCAELFAHDPDVAELAWLEWAMQSTFTAADAAPLTHVGFAAATAAFDAADWERLVLNPVAGTALRPVTHDLPRLWRSLADDADQPTVERLAAPHWLLVWREGEEAVFALLPDHEGEALNMALEGETFADICAHLAERLAPEEAAAAAGAMLAHWLELGLIGSVRTTMQHVSVVTQK